MSSSSNRTSPRYKSPISSGRTFFQGDSGGPLVHRSPHSGVFRQLGVTSWGFGCAIRGFPGVYADVHSECDAKLCFIPRPDGLRTLYFRVRESNWEWSLLES